EDVGWINTIENLTEATPVELRFELARAVLQLAIFENVLPGSILPFTLWPDAVAVSGDIDLFRADYGQDDGRICCRIKAVEDEGDENMSEQKSRVNTSGKLADSERVELESIQAYPRGGQVISTRNVLDRLQVSVSVELGRTQITVKDLRALRHGQILSLDQMVGEPLTIFANGQKMAFGEVVAVANDRYGVRVTALVDDAGQDAGGTT
ncbi:MAG: FliM/FliN family flagellar motor switch protein, partial [Acidocella sp.]|uniref:FliM/FliN family flagellar motor switch protein n=1 Tax=Acidocella sp. TaxID=50710 RepID=UPI003FD6D529